MFIAQMTAIFAQYAPFVVDSAIHDPEKGIPVRSARPTLALIKTVCDEFNEPVTRAIKELEDKKLDEEIARMKERFMERSGLKKLFAVPEKRTPEQQAQIDEMVEGLRKRLGVTADGVKRQTIPMPESADGKHALRVEAQLAARRAAKDSTGEEP